MDQALKTKLDEAEQSLVQTFELALLYGDDDAKNISKYQEIFEQIQKTKDSAIRSDQALEKSRAQSTIEEFEASYASELNGKRRSLNTKSTKEYKAFTTRLEEIKQIFDSQSNSDQGINPTNTVESDEMVMETQVQVIDPLTKRRMENPVKNKLCGHNYEKSSIMEAVRINRRLRCPVAGCGNKQFIQKTHLEDDDALKMYIMRMRNVDADEDDPISI